MKTTLDRLKQIRLFSLGLAVAIICSLIIFNLGRTYEVRYPSKQEKVKLQIYRTFNVYYKIDSKTHKYVLDTMKIVPVDTIWKPVL